MHRTNHVAGWVNATNRTDGALSYLMEITVNYEQALGVRMGYPNRVPLTRFNRPLTHPDVPAMNRGYDNVHGDYIMRVNEIIGTKDKYKIIDMMGQGTFGQVAKCQKMSTGELFAIKVIKNKPAFYNQSLQEIRVLKKLQYAHKHNNRILNMKDHFYFRNHTCIVFDLFYISYYHLLNSKMGTPRLVMKDIQLITHNLLQTLVTLRNINIIHADLKPDNILLKSKNNIHDAIIIDYGLALMKSDGMHCNVQTPYYRAPEVILKLAFDCSIDMWSFGCIVAELYLGRPLFPSVNENVLILMMVTMLKQYPSKQMLLSSPVYHQYFHIQNTQRSLTVRLKYYEDRHLNIGQNRTLQEKIMKEGPSHMSSIDKEYLFDFLKRVLVIDPSKRYTPQQALNHPFIQSHLNKHPKHQSRGVSRIIRSVFSTRR